MKYIFNKKTTIGRLGITAEMRSKDNDWGRFGGGWNWHVGIQSGGNTVMVFLLVMSLRFSLKRKEVCA
ncbi:hypothetical protein JWJ90_13255 [Desulfobulbus rhabdoformis]|uniref:hypothetical protein n=1 Tax=Desulfobulbus rhabdoformis TaxID=34032 RepID=UPI001966684A|nr:hypothetical protein [Desulfobulbus rhabdoformis]MBM9615247.1 hypothetical protein [Desulfobulbus rhabdoformis]